MLAWAHKRSVRGSSGRYSTAEAAFKGITMRIETDSSSQLGPDLFFWMSRQPPT
jgi:hypothetical protein